MAYLKQILIFSLFAFCQGKIDSDLIRSLGSLGRSDVLINFSGENSDAIRSVLTRSFRSRFSKVQALNSALHSLMDKSQEPILNFLKSQNVQSQSFWSSNQMVVRNANLLLLRGIDGFPQVSRIQKLPTVQLSPIAPTAVSPQADTVEYGVAMIQADQVWTQFNTKGEGVVVANIDTGVRGTHEALAGNFRSDHGWYDPINNATTPDDGNGHGTHTMGTIAGQGGIGVAPGAKWIACRGCGTDSCDAASLLACGQWMLAPTNPDNSDPQSSLIPDVVSNSWGSNIGGDSWYDATIKAWTEAGIAHAFAIGNSGPACRTGGSPGDGRDTFSVGSTDNRDRLSIFSSKGPAGTFPNRYTKPDVAAPGSNVRSAWNESDTSYNTISGTSMATPHVAGVMALMIAANKAKTGGKLDFQVIKANLQNTTDTQNLTVAFPNFPCDGFFTPSNRYPNNQFGYGRINALKAVNATVNGLPPSTKSARRI